MVFEPMYLVQDLSDKKVHTSEILTSPCIPSKQAGSFGVFCFYFKGFLFKVENTSAVQHLQMLGS